MDAKYRQWAGEQRRVRACFGADRTQTVAEGIVLGYQPNPTLVIRKDDGQTLHWAAFLCEPVEAPMSDEARAAVTKELRRLLDKIPAVSRADLIARLAELDPS